MRIPSLRTVADVTLIVAALSMTTMAARQMYMQQSQRPPEPRVVQAQQRVVLPGVDFTQSQRTLLLVLSSKCPYCEKSMPFYSRMMASKSEHSRVLVVGGEDQKVLSNYLKLHEVSVDGVASVNGEQTPSQLTPTAIMVGPDGIVSKVWKGQLSPDAENEVMQLMSR